MRMVLRCERSCLGGFTLIELLVVISIIALLLAIIMPGLNNARLAAKQVVCAAQMKQWALATLAYTGENNSTIPTYADTRDMTNAGHALNIDTFWYNRLSHYLTKESQGTWGMDRNVRLCPMARAKWGEKAVWVGVYYSLHNPERAPFVFPNLWSGSSLTKMCDPFKLSTVKSPANYLMMLDVERDRIHDSIGWQWNTDYDGDGMNDSNSGILANNSAPYNWAQPKIHRNGCNVALFDGHVQWIRYQEFWELGGDGYPVHRFWFNNNRP